MKYYTLFLILICLHLNCANGSAYIRDRSNDLSDIVGVSVDTSIGASASVGPVTTGVIVAQSFSRIRNGTVCFSTGNVIERAIYGLLDPSGYECNNAQATFLVGFNNESTLHREAMQGQELARRRKRLGRPTQPPLYFYGRLKVRAGLGLGVSVELNWLEAVDFIFGFFGIDFLDDDIHAKTIELHRLRKKRIAEDVIEIDSQIRKKETSLKYCRNKSNSISVNLYSFERKIIKYEKKERSGDKEFFTQYYHTYPEKLLFLKWEEYSLSGNEKLAERRIYFKDGLPFSEEREPTGDVKDAKSDSFSQQDWTDFSAKKDLEKICR